MEDRDLVKRALAGDDDAFVQLHDRYARQIYQYAYVQTGNKEDAEELLQDIIYKMARHLTTYNGQSSFKTWLFTIGRNTVIDYHRKQKKHRKTMSMSHDVLEYHTQPLHSAEEEVIGRSEKDEVISALSQLPTDYRMVLQLRWIDGFSINETAEVMAKSVLAIKGLQNRAKKKMAELMQSEVNHNG